MEGQKSSTAEFIEKAIEKHGNTYDYSQVKYVNSTTPVNIICKIHGLFMQKPCKHLLGQGCKECGMIKRAETRRRWSKDVFIAKLKNKFGELYDYSQIEDFKDPKKDYVTIICKEHGPIKAIPFQFIKSKGCPYCEKPNTWYITHKNEWIDACTKKYNGKYTYEHTSFEHVTMLKDEVTVTCPEHGDYKISIGAHLQGYYCKNCASNIPFYNLSNDEIQKKIDEYIEKAQKKHGNYYNYDLITPDSFRDTSHNITIICPVHGTFVQNRYNHLTGKGCQLCCDNGTRAGLIYRNNQKLQILQENDLLNMHPYVILDLIGMDKFPTEFKQLALSGAGSESRREQIERLKESYNIEDEADDNDTNSMDDETPDSEINIQDYTGDESHTQDYQDDTDESELKTFREIDQFSAMSEGEDPEIFTTGDKWIYIIESEISKLWGCVLRDNEQGNTNTIDRIKNAMWRIDNETPFKKYLYTQFIEQYDEVTAFVPA